MKNKTSELKGKGLDWAVSKALGRCTVVGVEQVRTHLESLNEDELWNTLCEYTPGAIDASIMSDVEMVDYGVKNWRMPAYSTDPAQGQPILGSIKGFEFKHWLESKAESCCEAHIHNHDGNWIAFGPTMLIAGLRAFVASVLGDEIDMPEQLL